jgi:NAD(P)-dependent dehydrogenase (short-subunit alcohol dehydrogenase family)
MAAKTAIVTGASSGIGLALARAFLARGYAVIGNARSQSSLLKALGSADRFVPVEGDIGRAEVVKRLCVDDVEQMLSTNLKGFFYPSQEAARHMRARGSGSIINISASLALQPQSGFDALLAVLVKGGIAFADESNGHARRGGRRRALPRRCRVHHRRGAAGRRWLDGGEMVRSWTGVR